LVGWLTLKIGKPLGNMLGCVFVTPLGLVCGVVVLEELGYGGVSFVEFVLVKDPFL
jgi:hypothetical protein